MQITVRYFASIREAVGTGSERWETAATDLAALRDELIQRGPTYAGVLARGRAVRMARNQTMCPEASALHDGDEIAFFPPVTGG